MRQHYVYVIFRVNGIPAYVGLGKDNRWKAHFNGSKKHLNWHLGHIIAQGDCPVIFVRKNLTREEAAETEVALISAIGRIDLGTGPLTNRTAGGNGVRKRAPFTLSEEHAKKIGNALRGKPKSAAHRAKLTEVRTGQRPGPRREDWKKNIKIGILKAYAENPVMWITNGTESRMTPKALDIPEGWRRGRTI